MINIILFCISISIYSLPSKCYKITNPPSEVINYITNNEYKQHTIIQSESVGVPTPTPTTTLQITSVITETVSATMPVTSIIQSTPIVETSIQTLMTSTIVETSMSSSPTSVSVLIKDEILDLHNQERRMVNVTNSLYWSDTLELSANDLSKNLSNRGCILEHSLANGVFGQNLYAAYGTTIPNFKNAVNAWIDEKFLINRPNITFSEIGHYLIMVSSRYNNVGCSAAINYDKRCYVVTCDYN